MKKNILITFSMLTAFYSAQGMEADYQQDPRLLHRNDMRMQNEKDEESIVANLTPGMNAFTEMPLKEATRHEEFVKKLQDADFLYYCQLLMDLNAKSRGDEDFNTGYENAEKFYQEGKNPQFILENSSCVEANNLPDLGAIIWNFDLGSNNQEIKQNLCKILGIEDIDLNKLDDVSSYLESFGYIGSEKNWEVLNSLLDDGKIDFYTGFLNKNDRGEVLESKVPLLLFLLKNDYGVFTIANLIQYIKDKALKDGDTEFSELKSIVDDSDDNRGITPLHWCASMSGKMPVLQLLLIARLLIAAGANINAEDADGNTPLHIAAKGNFVTMVSLLKAQGAMINAQNKRGNTPLHLAAESNAVQVLSQLLAEGALINSQNGVNDTPLHLAVDNNSVETVQVLLEAGARVNVKGQHGDSPLHVAAFDENDGGDRLIQMVQLLINKGADTNAKNDSGFTPLHMAAARDVRPIIEFLSSLPDTNINAQNTRGETPLDLAAQNFDEETDNAVGMLKQLGAKSGDELGSES